MKEHLQPWYDQWLKDHADTNLLYVNRTSQGKPSLEQVHFVRDILSGVMWAGVKYDNIPNQPEPRKDCKVGAYVVGEHSSKSVRLPVYQLERPDLGIKFVLRDNYHDWNVSVVSEEPIATDLHGFELDYQRGSDRERFPNGYTPGSSWGYCYFQGFPLEYQFGPYSENKRKFSLCIESDYSVHTFIWLIMRDIKRLASKESA